MQDRRETVRIFRNRLGQAMDRSGLSQSALARRVGVDRSTLSQLLADENERLPRADTVAAIAAALQVSLDWLLGLSQEARPGADVLEQSLQVESGEPANSRQLLMRWHEEAVGYKIRYVPTSLPDLLKSERVLGFEFSAVAAERRADARAQAQGRLAYTRLPESEMEVCNTVQAIEGFARGEGNWAGLAAEDRIEQLDHMARLVDELYPTLRWFLFDGRARYAVPYTIFGPKRAVVYVGQLYFVFNTTGHIRILTRHFDDLIRAAQVQPPEVPALLRRLRDELARAAA